jgi:hypothetical protein
MSAHLFAKIYKIFAFGYPNFFYSRSGLDDFDD